MRRRTKETSLIWAIYWKSVPTAIGRWPERRRLSIMNSAPFSKDLSVQSRCRLLTAVTLLLHSFFGCGMHDVCGCAPISQDRLHMHGPGGGCDSDHNRPAVQHDHGHSQDFHRDHNDTPCGHDDAPSVAAAEMTPQVGDCGCHRQSRHNHLPSSSCGIACNYVHLSDVAYSFDAPLIGFPPQHPKTILETAVAQAHARNRIRGELGAAESMSICVQLCTWQL